MFSCLVAPTGDSFASGAYRGTVGSELLERELLKRLANEKFILRFAITSRSSPFSMAR